MLGVRYYIPKSSTGHQHSEKDTFYYDIFGVYLIELGCPDVGDDVHPESDGTFGDFCANTASTDSAHRTYECLFLPMLVHTNIDRPCIAIKSRGSMPIPYKSPDMTLYIIHTHDSTYAKDRRTYASYSHIVPVRKRRSQHS
jgi:hypothetical protein